MNGKKFAEDCRAVATALNIIADEAETADKAAPKWVPGTKAETMGMLIDLASDFNKMEED